MLSVSCNEGSQDFCMRPIWYFFTTLKGCVCRGGSIYTERGSWKCLGMKESMSSTLPEIVDILSELTRYADKSLWEW